MGWVVALGPLIKAGAAFYEAVQTAQSVTGWGGAIGNAARGACDLYRKAPTGGKVAFLALSAFMEASCGPYWAESGVNSQDFLPEETPPPPFEGGQCPVFYRVRGTWTHPTSGLSPRTATSNALVGPIVEVALIHTPVGGNISTSFFARSADGTTRTWGGATTAPPNPTIQSWEMIREDGQPDDCGDPPPEFNPSPGGNTPPVNNWNNTYTYTDPDGRDFEIKINLPEIGPNGDVRIPVEIDGINVDLVGSGPGGDTTAPKPEPDLDGLQESDGRDVPPGGEDEEEEEPVAAVIVVVTAEPPNRSIEVGPLPKSYLLGPGIDAGWLRFSYPTEEQILGRESRKRLTEGVQILFPERGVAFGYQLKMAYGFSGRVYPVRVKV